MHTRRQALIGASALTFALLAPSITFAAPAPQKPLVKIVATGGTIANSPTGRMAVDTVLAQIPEIANHARIEVVDLIRVGSSRDLGAELARHLGRGEPHPRERAATSRASSSRTARTPRRRRRTSSRSP